MRITYYLFRKSVTTFDQVWRDGDKAPGDYREVSLKASVPFEAEAYLLANKPATPDWWSFVQPYCEIPATNRPLNRSSSFVLLLKAKDRIFAATFGHGFAAINRSRLEPDFGLKVTLNTVDPKKLRSVQARNVDPTTVSKQLVVNQDSAISVFDVDFYQDLLSKMEGVPDDDAFGKRVAGADACYLTSEITVPALATKCAQLLKHYASKSYSKHFSFVDQVRPIRDDALIATLDAKLSEALKAADTAALGFALPDIAGYDLVHTYRATRGRWAQTFDDLSAGEILEAYNEDHVGADDQSDVQIVALNSDGNPLDVFTLRECAVFQVSFKRQVYVLTLNKWYLVNSEYAERVAEQVNKLDVIKTAGFLPTIGKKTSEGAYNKAAAKSKGMALLDKSLVRPTGPTSAIEVCDLFSNKGEFIHVKRHTRSATLSHLLAQGTVSARLFIDDRGYRVSFRKALPVSFRGLVDSDKVEATRHTVVYAISAPSSKKIPAELPFFTKVNLLFHSREIQRTGMATKLYHIQEQ